MLHGLVTLLVALALLGIYVLRFVGMLSHQALGVVLVVGVVWAVVARVVAGVRGRVVVGPRTSGHAADAVGRAFAFLSIGGACLWVFPSTADFTGFLWAIAGLTAVAVALQFVVLDGAFRGVTAAFAGFGLLVFVDVVRGVLPAREATVALAPPFEGEWWVGQGGPSPLQNHHLAAYNQHFALDVLRLQDGRIMTPDVVDRTGVHAWEAALVAPSAGTVVAAVDGMPDLELGEVPGGGKEGAAGNVVVIRADAGHYVVLAHLREGSVAVAEGDRVAVGDPIGRVGNSGNTTLPHLHLQVQTHAELWHPDNRSLPFTIAGGGPLRRNDRIGSAR